LSWLIAELGKYKDKGLKITALKEAFMEVNNQSETQALSQAYTILGKEESTIEEILQNTSQITKTFIEEGNLEFILNSK
jgi:vacuolar-type H+-ATPase subunit H